MAAERVTGSFTRRRFCATALAAASSSAWTARAQTTPHFALPASVVSVERTRILAAADRALAAAAAAAVAVIEPITVATAKSPLNPKIFYSVQTDADAELHFSAPAALLKHASMHVAALTAAYTLTGEDRYALRAGQILFAWFVAPSTRLEPSFEHARCSPASRQGSPSALLDAVPLAEMARSLSFLVDTAALAPPDLAAARDWFRSLLNWMNNSRLGGLARDSKDHVGSAWLLLSAAIARMLHDDKLLLETSALFRKPTLRQQINSTGSFPHEVESAYPYRNALFNFDLLAAACQLLSTNFDNLWEFELADGPGMRSVAAYMYPVINTPARWPWPADAEQFRELPGRRHALLFSGRAYSRPEYVELWQRLPDLSDQPTMQPTLPITQPLLLLGRAPHGA